MNTPDDSNKTLTPAERIQAIQARRDAARSKAAALFDEQKATDLEAIADLEDQYGAAKVHVLHTKYHVDGLPVSVAVRVLEPEFYKRHRDMIRGRNAGRKDLKDVSEALDTLSRASVVYPDRDTFDKMLSAFPQALESLNVLVSSLSDLDEEEQKKG